MMEIYTKAARKLFDLARQKAGPFPDDGSRAKMEAYVANFTDYVERLGALHHLSAVGLVHHFLALDAQRNERKRDRLAAEIDGHEQLQEEVAIMQQALGTDDRNQPIIEIFRAYLAKYPDEKPRLVAMGGEVAFFASKAA
jgi:hypothetical protein